MSQHSDHTVIDVVSPTPPYTIPKSNLSGVSLKRGTSVGDFHYFKGTTTLSRDKDFYFEITFKRERERPSKAIWLGFVYENWFRLSQDDQIKPGLGNKAVTWSYQPLVGPLSYEHFVYAHDPISEDDPISQDKNITIGFGLRSFKDDEENDCWSVFYMKDKRYGKEIVRKESLPDGLYPVIRLEQSILDFSINRTPDFKYQGCQPLHIPHRYPVGLFKCSPDRRYAACYSGKDMIISLWRLHNGLAPEFVQYISVPDFDLEKAGDEQSGRPCEQLTLAVSNTDGNELPQLALSRYHADLNSEHWLFCFLNYKGEKFLPFHQGNIVGNLHLLDDGKTLLVLGVHYLFVVDMKLKSLIHTFNTNHLDIKASTFFTRSRLRRQETRQPFLLPLGLDHFLCYYDPDHHVTMWHVPTGRLVQTFRLKIQSTDKYHYDKDLCLIAFYGTNGLEIFSTKTGISICKVERDVGLKQVKPIGVKFVPGGGAPRLLTVDGNNEECILRIRNSLASCMVTSEISTETHTFWDRLEFSYIATDDSPSLSVSIVTPLMATVACLVVENLISVPVINSLKVLDLVNSSTSQEQSSNLLGLNIEVVRQKSPLKEYFIKISRLQRESGRVDPNICSKLSYGMTYVYLILPVNYLNNSVNFYPEPGSDHKPTCHWLPKYRFVVIGQYAVQIINAEKSIRTPVIEFVWCLPSTNAAITGIRLLKLNKDKDFKQMEVTYRHDKASHKNIVDITQLSISFKHASRFIQYFGDVENRTTNVYTKKLKQSLDSEDILQANEVEFETKTSTFGHIIRGPTVDAAKRVHTILDASIYRPTFYDELWNQSALMDAIDTGDFEIAEDIIKYCLKKNDRLLEPGYVAIIIAALPTITRSRPNLAVLIAQYISHIQLSRFDTVLNDVEYSTKKSYLCAFTRTEQLPKITLGSQSPLQRWWTKQNLLFLSWWNKERLFQPVRLCVFPLCGLNNCKVGVSVFAQLAFLQSPVFDEPAFQAVVQYKWDTFARWYYMGFLFLYTSYALAFIVIVSISSSALAIPGISYTLIGLSCAFLIIFDIWPLFIRWKSLAYWSSIYHWVDRAAFVMVLVSTIVTHRGYDSSVNLQAWTVLTLWIFVVLNFRVFRGLGLFLTLLINILSSLGWLAILMTTIIFGFSNAMWILLRDATPPPSSGNPFATIDSSLNSLWEFLGGDFTLIDNWSAGRSINIMRVQFTFISTIVLLNVLIAVLNNVYTEKKAIARNTWIRHRAEFIATVEVFMLKTRRQDLNLFPAILFYEVTPGKFQDYYQTVKNNHPWISPEDRLESKS